MARVGEVRGACERQAQRGAASESACSSAGRVPRSVSGALLPARVLVHNDKPGLHRWPLRLALRRIPPCGEWSSHPRNRVGRQSGNRITLAARSVRCPVFDMATRYGKTVDANSGEPMFDHVKIGVSDFAKSKAFYVKALAPLGAAVVGEGVPTYGIELCRPDNNASLCLFLTDEKPAHLHIAFMADTRAKVDAFYRAALEAGGKDNGPPGLQTQNSANYY